MDFQTEVCAVGVGQLISIRKGRKVNKKVLTREESRYPVLNIECLRGGEPTEYASDDRGILCNSDDILIVSDGANAGLVGTNLVGYVGSTITKLEVLDKKRVNYLYLYHFLKVKFDYLNNNTIGAAIPHLDKMRLLQLEIPLPSMEGQIHVVSVLEKIEGIKTKERRKNELFRELYEAIFYELVGPSASEYEKWDSQKIKDLVEAPVRSGPFGSQLLRSEIQEEGEVAVFGIDNAVKRKFSWGKERRFISMEKYEQLKRYTVYPDDVIITIMGTVGCAAVVPAEIPVAITTKHLATLTVDRRKVEPQYIASAFNHHPEVHQQIQQKDRGAIMSGLNIGIIREIELKIPPLVEQQKYVHIVSHLEKIELSITNSLIIANKLYEETAREFFLTKG
ncbi:restriction endonuclease subunit S [Paenibacillus sp. H1-7]|uniref:restriction endonuclease subunit S n=1 Tax=Paenibacillus sp. H1-7 TaxID=2282849 RepID=UPI001EF96699|nr:restriction endonuclease subunit S [Paenibacillus sp. H1-7]ULL13047.1 restriction endonuclease subunit S [Paenibacillus sp. H1-7]